MKFFFKSDTDIVKISYAKFSEFFYETILQQEVYKDPQMPLIVKKGKVIKKITLIQIYLQILLPCDKKISGRLFQAE